MVNEAMGPSNPFEELLTPENLEKLQHHPKIGEYLQQPDFMEMLGAMGSSPQMMQMYMQDPRMQELMGVLLGIDPKATGSMPGTNFTPPPAQPTPPQQPAT